MSIMAAFGGWSYMNTPDHQISFDYEPPQSYESDDASIVFYYLTVANTGQKPQKNVRVFLDQSALETLTGKIKVSNAGIVPRTTEITDGSSMKIIDLGAVKPGRRVRIAFSLKVDSGDDAPDWDEVLHKVEPASGDAIRASAGTLALGRAAAALLGVFTLF